MTKIMRLMKQIHQFPLRRIKTPKVSVATVEAIQNNNTNKMAMAAMTVMRKTKNHPFSFRVVANQPDPSQHFCHVYEMYPYLIMQDLDHHYHRCKKLHPIYYPLIAAIAITITGAVVLTIPTESPSIMLVATPV